MDIYIGLKFRNHQPSFLSGDDDECESDRDLDSDDPTNDPNSIMYRPKDHWKYAFGGDVSLTKMEPKGHIKAKGKSKVRLDEERSDELVAPGNALVPVFP